MDEKKVLNECKDSKKTNKINSESKSLLEIRECLDRLDKEMLAILAERMNLIPNVADYKRQNKIPRYQPDRERAVLESKRKLAEEMSLNPDLVEDIYKRIIQDAHRIEKDIMGE